MYFVACQKCGEIKILAGNPDVTMTENLSWTCEKCGAGQIVTMMISKNAKRGDLRDIIGGMKFRRKNAAVPAPMLTRMKDEI